MFLNLPSFLFFWLLGCCWKCHSHLMHTFPFTSYIMIVLYISFVQDYDDDDDDDDDDESSMMIHNNQWEPLNCIGNECSVCIQGCFSLNPNWPMCVCVCRHLLSKCYVWNNIKNGKTHTHTQNKRKKKFWDAKVNGKHKQPKDGRQS